MAIYDFRFEPKQNPPAPNDDKETKPAIPFRPFGLPNVDRHSKITFNNINVDTEEVKETLLPGFRTMDIGVKKFLSDIVVPTRDGTKQVEARIAGGDKTILFWTQDLKAGRVKLPVISINRTGAEWYAEKFSPPYHPMYKQFTDSSGTRVKYTYRPLPYMLEYQLSIWAERKRDAEYVIYQIMSKLSPLAVVEVGDQYLQGPLTLKFNNQTDSSDVDAAGEELAKVRYDVSISAEGWLPVTNETIVPVVLGKVVALNDEDGEILDVFYPRNIQ